MANSVWSIGGQVSQDTAPGVRSCSRILKAAIVFYKRFISTLITSVVVALGALLIMFAFGVRVPSQHSNEALITTAQAQMVKKPNLLGASSANGTCASSRSQTTTLFNTCPSFVLNYANRKNGPTNMDNFNVYSGAPFANQEAQYYVSNPANLGVENGSLYLKAMVQPYAGYNYTSARIDTKNKEDFLYGKFVIRATLPSGVGTWPAIWMLPSQPKYAKFSPASDPNRYLNDGEMDIAESIGVEPHVVYGVAHSVTYPNNGPDRSFYKTITLPDNDTTFHDYELDWTPTVLTFLVDGQPYFTYTKKPNADWHTWPYDQPYYLVFNLALGGNWGGSDTKDFPGDGINKQALPAALKIQTVRYYAYNGPR